MAAVVRPVRVALWRVVAVAAMIGGTKGDDGCGLVEAGLGGSIACGSGGRRRLCVELPWPGRVVDHLLAAYREREPSSSAVIRASTGAAARGHPPGRGERLGGLHRRRVHLRPGVRFYHDITYAFSPRSPATAFKGKRGCSGQKLEEEPSRGRPTRSATTTRGCPHIISAHSVWSPAPENGNAENAENAENNGEHRELTEFPLHPLVPTLRSLRSVLVGSAHRIERMGITCPATTFG